MRMFMVMVFMRMFMVLLCLEPMCGIVSVHHPMFHFPLAQSLHRPEVVSDRSAIAVFHLSKQFQLKFSHVYAIDLILLI